MNCILIIIRNFKNLKGGVISWRIIRNLKFNVYLFKLKKIKFTELANLVVYSAPVGIFLGRIANFINAELIGRPTDGHGRVYGEETFQDTLPNLRGNF